MYEDLREVTEYFGEEYAPADATRLLRTVRDFVLLFEKGMADIRVRTRQSCQSCLAAWLPGRQAACKGGPMRRRQWERRGPL